QQGACRDGTSDIIFERLPGSLDIQTLRASSDKDKVLGLRHRMIESTQAMNERVAIQQRALRELEDLQVVLSDRRGSLQEHTRRLDELSRLFTTATAEKIRTGAASKKRIAKTLKEIRRERERIAKDQQELRARQREHQIKRDRVLRTLRRLSGQKRRFVQATVTVACTEQKAHATLSYVVPQARWRPEYDLDFDPRTQRASVTFCVIIEQSTGEDWSNVRLKVSTAQPKRGIEGPQPAPMRIRGEPRAKERVLVQSYERRDRLAAGGKIEASNSSAKVDDGGNTIAFVLPERATVRADGSRHWFPVDRVEGYAQQQLVALPHLRRGVFRIARLENPAPYPLLDGRINSFIRGAFVGRSFLSFTGKKEPMEISLGVEPSLAVVRQQRTDKAAVEGFLSRKKHRTRAYRTIVHNRGPKVSKIEIRDQIPVAQNRKIGVKLIDEGTTPSYQIDQERGLLSWTIQVPSLQKKEVDIAFEVDFPDDWEVPKSR
ncbi:MAG: mucoidy inhibitor MuiA family protein, partial [Myxococcota bacterium]